jgi:hypothetical protein
MARALSDDLRVRDLKASTDGLSAVRPPAGSESGSRQRSGGSREPGKASGRRRHKVGDVARAWMRMKPSSSG